MPTMEPVYLSLLQSPLGQDQVAVIKMWPSFEGSLYHCPYCANCCIRLVQANSGKDVQKRNDQVYNMPHLQKSCKWRKGNGSQQNLHSQAPCTTSCSIQKTYCILKHKSFTLKCSPFSLRSLCSHSKQQPQRLTLLVRRHVCIVCLQTYIKVCGCACV